MKVQELINIVESKEIYSLFDLELEIPNLPECVAEHLDIEEHWLYTSAVNVYKCEDGFVGIWGLYKDSTQLSYKDLEVICEASEYKEVKSISYIPK